MGRDGGVSFLGLGNSLQVGEKTGAFYSAETNNPGPLLALSTDDEPFACHEFSKLSPGAVQVDCVFLQQLVHRYAKGRLWSFHRDGTLTTSDEEGKSGQSGSENSNSGPESRRKRLRASETSMLNTFFPGASQVMFVPLWDAASSQWHSGTFCWTTQETNVFSSTVDLSAVMGFASSIMTECNRIDSFNADRRKGDFIGKVSHELRSPLHGILAAAEFLQGTGPSLFQSSLIETINSCGRTLLDTMNQLLDFSKIVSSDRKRRQVRRNAEDSSMQSTDNPSHLDPLVVTDVSQLLEEVVEGVCRGHSFGKRSTAKIDQGMALPNDSQHDELAHQAQVDFQENVEIILDIGDDDWLYETQPGSLRRTVMNVLGNALKYTTQGHILVRLEVEKRCLDVPRRQGLQDEVKLSVSDTGKGISDTFLREKLFKPFAQEDPLAVGTGLGLSIVRSLVKKMSGRVRIESRPGEGTTVSVLLPLTRFVRMKEPAITQSSAIMSDTGWRDLRRIRHACQNKSFTIWGLESPDVNQSRLFWTTVGHYMTKWVSLELVPFSSNQPVDFVLGDEKEIASATSDQLPAGLRSLLIFCNSPADFQRNQMRLSSIADQIVFVWLPCGPKKLARGIFEILESRTSSLDDPKSHSCAQEHLHSSQYPRAPSSPASIHAVPQVICSESTSCQRDTTTMSTGRHAEVGSVLSKETEGETSTVIRTAPGEKNLPLVGVGLTS